MPDKLARARHRKPEADDSLAERKISRAKHRRLPAGAPARPHPQTPAHARPDEGAQLETEGAQLETVNMSAGIMSVCVLLSRITGFARTWAMAYALGSTFLSSSYQVANNLPNMLYELVMAGMLVTAFLPVYISVRKKLGNEAGNEYASNLLSLVTVILGLVTAFSMAFPHLIVYTQTFYSDQNTMGTAVFLFQFFAIQTVFYGASSIMSGLLNANRNYFWSTIAPVANNVIVIATFVLYAVVSPHNQQAALYIIAVGNPLGVAAQMAIQIPALKRNGIRLRPRINLHDPALRDTVALGAPTIIVMVCSFATVSVMNAASYCFAEDGPSIIAYARLWYALPYSLLAIPITTALFTELTHLHENGDRKGFIDTVAKGISEIMFLLVPFALYLVAFSSPLVTLYHFGAFTMENVAQIAAFLCGLAAALPFYGVSSYLQKVFSSLRKMGVYAAASAAASIVQIALTALFVVALDGGVPLTIVSVAWASAVFYLVVDFIAIAYLKRTFGHVGTGRIAQASATALLLGGAGALAGFGVLQACSLLFGALDGSIPQALAYVVAGGTVSLVVTFGTAAKLHVKEASFIFDLASRITEKVNAKTSAKRSGR